MKNIYVVWGETGEYADRRSWPVAAYRYKRQAQRHANIANAKAKKLEANGCINHMDLKNIKEAMKEAMVKIDPNVEVDYTGVSYYIGTIIFLDTIPADIIQRY